MSEYGRNSLRPMLLPKDKPENVDPKHVLRMGKIQRQVNGIGPIH
jgi:hypothetical protein